MNWITILTDLLAPLWDWLLSALGGLFGAL